MRRIYSSPEYSNSEVRVGYSPQDKLYNRVGLTMYSRSTEGKLGVHTRRDTPGCRSSGKEVTASPLARPDDAFHVGINGGYTNYIFFQRKADHEKALYVAVSTRG